jgi:hypothetical protein
MEELQGWSYKELQGVTRMEELQNRFWGLVVTPGKRFETEVQEAFRITKVTSL